MSKSLPLKRKKILTVSSSDEENEIDNIPKAPRTERLKAKKFVRSENNQDCFYLVQFCIEPSRYSIVPESKIQLNTDNPTAGVVISNGKKYSVKIKKKGTEKFVTEASEFY
ncbi:hypothetical protein BpHYR1_052479, partial [Brachionus plicatilis]